MKLSPSHIQLGAAVLAGSGAGDRAAERLRHRLKAVADAEHGQAEVEQRGVQLRGAVGVDAGRAARQHDGLRILGLDLLDARGVRDDLRVHPGLADAARDQLRVLRAEVDHQDGAGRCGFHRPSLVAGTSAYGCGSASRSLARNANQNSASVAVSATARPVICSMRWIR